MAPPDTVDASSEHLRNTSTIMEDAREEHEGGSSQVDAPSDRVDVSSVPSPAPAQDAVTQLLRFLAGASNELLCSIAIGLAACTYFILGRLGLVLMGALGGIVLHATWESQSSLAAVEADHRKQKGLEVLQRVLDWRERQPMKLIDVDEDGHTNETGLTDTSFEDFRPATAAALKELVEATIRDYVDYWYSPILPGEQSFPQTCHQTLVSFLRSISRALSKKRAADAFLDFLTNTSSIVIVFLGELSNAVLASQGSDLSPGEAVHEYLSSNPDSNLGYIMDEEQQHKKFKLIANDLLRNFIEKSVYSCGPAEVFLEQILGEVIMETSLKVCSKPEWLNGWIVYLLEGGEPDFSQAIDVGMGMSPLAEGDTRMDQPVATQSNDMEETSHRNRVSKAEDAMKEAMDEAERISQLIAEEDLRRAEETPTAPSESPSLTPRSDDNHTIPKDTPDNNANGATGLVSEPASLASHDVNPESKLQFTSFDQISPLRNTPKSPAPLTLQDANITILDDSSPNDNGRLRGKPTRDYLVQIEPHSSRHPGWMIVRKYADFETLHEVLKRIAQVSGVTAFTQNHSTLPTWKNQTKSTLRVDLETYLCDACRYQPLAESVGMKRFLEKEQSQSQEQSGKSFQGIGWPSPAAFETMGKGLVDNLMSASKGAAEGGKSVFGGMTGALGNISSGNRMRSESKSSLGARAGFRSSASLVPELEGKPSTDGIEPASEAVRNETSLSGNEETTDTLTLERRHSSTSTASDKGINGTSIDIPSASSSSDLGRNVARRDSTPGQPLSSSSDLGDIALPPPPSDMPDDYGILGAASPAALSRNETKPRTSTSSDSPTRFPRNSSISTGTAELGVKAQNRRTDPTPFTEEETRIALELIFAMINELYTLSSAWNIRRTLLMAAKTFLLRPGNPSLTSIQSLIQESVIASNTSDVGIAAHLRKIRENTMPTEEELKAWPKELGAEEKEKLRLRARKLVIERGVPPALTGVMGQAATGEAVGRVFDCLQDEKVARGLMFGLLLQGIKVITN